MKVSSNNSAKPSDDRIKSKFVREAPNHDSDRHRGQPFYKKQSYRPTE